MWRHTWTKGVEVGRCRTRRRTDTTTWTPSVSRSRWLGAVKSKMKRPSFETFFFITVGSLLLVALLFGKPSPKPERYIDYCGWSMEKRPGAVKQEGITPLLLPDKDVPKYQQHAPLIRPATPEELQILLRRYERRTLVPGYQLWTVTADAPAIVRTLARQYQCTVEGMLDTSQ